MLHKIQGYAEPTSLHSPCTEDFVQDKQDSSVLQKYHRAIGFVGIPCHHYAPFSFQMRLQRTEAVLVDGNHLGYKARSTPFQATRQRSILKST